MKKLVQYLVTILITFMIFSNVSAKEQVKLYLFHVDGCHHCK